MKAKLLVLALATLHGALAAGDLAWVGSESEIHAIKGTDMLMVASTETMVRRKSGAGWKIVHIHWSSRSKR